MDYEIVKKYAGWIQWTHQRMLAISGDLTDEQMARQPGRTAPPIGWHLFHIARWADRLQTSFDIKSTEADQQSELRGEIWVVENLVVQWNLKPESLGLLELGPGMEVSDAVSLALVGTNTLLEYARRAFSEAEQAVSGLDVEQLQHSRQSILPQVETSSTGKLYVSGERDVIVLDDLIFHISHAGRHLGMVEALRGAMFEIVGTASV